MPVLIQRYGHDLSYSIFLLYVITNDSSLSPEPSPLKHCWITLIAHKTCCQATAKFGRLQQELVNSLTVETMHEKQGLSLRGPLWAVGPAAFLRTRALYRQQLMCVRHAITSNMGMEGPTKLPPPAWLQIVNVLCWYATYHSSNTCTHLSAQLTGILIKLIRCWPL